MAKPKVIVTITKSSHPEFEFFMDVRTSAGRQLRAFRGDRKYMDKVYDGIANEGRKDGIDIVLINN